MISVFKQTRDLHYNNDSSILQYDGSQQQTPIKPFNYTIEGLTRDVYPKPLHSHNDYWRHNPLFDALSIGAVSIESDIWHFPSNYSLKRTTTETSGITTTPNETLYFNSNEVYVGHNQVFLHPINTLFNLYLNPIYQFLEYSNPKFTNDNDGSNALLGDQSKHSIFYNDPEQQLYLWFDIKTNPNDTYDALKPLLQPFIDSNYLTYYSSTEDKIYQGPLVLTITGNLPIEKVSAEPVRYTFLDGPLSFFNSSANNDTLQKWSKLSQVASGSIQGLLGNDYNSTLRNNFTQEQKSKLKSYFDIAHKYNLKTRIWGDITWPWNLVDSHLLDLYQAGTDLLNVDDLKRAEALFSWTLTRN
ncbi:AIM6 [Candida pseudojiufengensis]|uniref:AIM6 n=1 Tax=Candida pseudojiufengensis TaxID=497109 RepID=UPI0022246C88|nr:AIM6 [Candida pseudojiufengensis]KAI5965169.1 AIM6 [Candida pseudojiufengensis]